MRQIYGVFVKAGLALVLCASTVSASAEALRVGVQIPLTGALARVGSGINEGIVVAVDVFNRTNGQYTIQAITVDDESMPAKAIAAVELLASRGVVAITGGYGSNNVGPAADAAQKLGLAYMTSGGVDANLIDKGNETFFRINNTQGYQKAVLGTLEEMGVSAVSIIYSTREVSANLAKDVDRDLQAKSVRVVMHPFDPAIRDFKPILNKVKLQDKSDVVLMVGYENDYVGILRAAKVLKPDVKAFIGLWSLATPKMATDFPDLMPNVFGTAQLSYPVEFKTDDGQIFADTYQRLYHKEPEYLGIFGYVQAMVLFEAIARAADAGTLQEGGVVAELRNTDRDTLIGRVRFDERGDNPNFVHRMAQHQEGKIRIVWPEQDANGTMIYPGVPW